MIGEWNNGTGRRKSSVARVFLKKGTGQIKINGKDIAEYFGRQTSIMIAKQPLMLTNHAETFDIMINVHGGGESGQACASRHGITASVQARSASAHPATAAPPTTRVTARPRHVSTPTGSSAATEAAGDATPPSRFSARIQCHQPHASAAKKNTCWVASA